MGNHPELSHSRSNGRGICNDKGGLPQNWATLIVFSKSLKVVEVTYFNRVSMTSY